MTLPPLAAEPIFYLGSFAVTNAYINSSIVTVAAVIFGYFIKQAVQRQQTAGAPRGLLNFFESTLEFLYKYFDQVTGSRAKSVKFLPLVGTLFFFILVSNWIGILPGIGSIGVFQTHGTGVELVPIFRPATSDLNLTLAMAFSSVAASHFLGIVAIGFFKYANKFIKLGDIWHALKTLSPIKILTALIEFLVGFIEIFSELAKMVSLSLRLFGNIFAGEVLLTVLGSLIAFVVPLPFIALELLVGLIQAGVFTMLVLVYLTVATAEIPEHGSKRESANLEATPMT